MNTKEIGANVITAVITALVLGIGAYAMGIFEKGSAAISEDQIEVVVNKMLVTEAGTNVKARIAEVDGQLIGLETRAEALETEVNELERDVFCLAGGCQ